jgi:hypothetical protein
MAHIDEKLEQLHQYHLIINDIAEALGYRRGQTYGPFELVGKVKELIHERDMTIEACRGTQMDDAGINQVKKLIVKLATVEAERDEAMESLVKSRAFKAGLLRERDAIRDQLSRAERTIAALRKPSEAVVEAGCIARFGLRNWTVDGQDEYEWTIYQRQQFADQLVAAVHAAEKEVNNGN